MLNKRTHPIAKFLTCSFLICLLCGCSGSPQAEERDQKEVDTHIEGILHYNYFYEEDGILYSSSDRFMYSEWNPVEFDYICTDLTCDHRQSDCSAIKVSQGDIGGEFALYYNDKLIIIDSYSMNVDEGSSPEDDKITMSNTWKTDVYEADVDGTNRKKVQSFSGSVFSYVANAAVLVNGKLYFGGATEDKTEIFLDDKTGVQTDVVVTYDDVIYCVDLNDYSIETFAETKGKDDSAYSYNMKVFDGHVYAIEYSSQADKAMWYRINIADNTCSEIIQFDSNMPRFVGAIEDTVYYYYEEEPVLYAMDVEKLEEREVLSVELDSIYAWILDGQLLVQTDNSMEEGSYFSEYTLFDSEGNAGQVYHFDDYVTFFEGLGDKLIFVKPFDEGRSEWWCEKDDLADLLDKGIYIGDFLGSNNDKL